MLETEPRASDMLGKDSITELHSRPTKMFSLIHKSGDTKKKGLIISEDSGNQSAYRTGTNIIGGKGFVLMYTDPLLNSKYCVILFSLQPS